MPRLPMPLKLGTIFKFQNNEFWINMQHRQFLEATPMADDSFLEIPLGAPEPTSSRSLSDAR
ncbi:MAG: hypothetical protein VB140_07830 [Burkholderia sp.]